MKVVKLDIKKETSSYCDRVQNQRESKQTSKTSWAAGLPKGYKTRQDMEKKVRQRETGSPSGGSGFKSDTDVKTESGENQRESKHTPKTSWAAGLPKGYNTRKDMEKKVRQRENGSPSGESRIKTYTEGKPEPGEKYIQTQEVKLKTKLLKKEPCKKTRLAPDLKIKMKSESQNPALLNEADCAGADGKYLDNCDSRPARCVPKSEPVNRIDLKDHAGSVGEHKPKPLSPIRPHSASTMGSESNNSKGKVGCANRLTVVSMNASSGGDTHGIDAPCDKRRTVINTFIQEFAPDIVFFQEFESDGINGSVWNKYNISDEYDYYGNKQGSILTHTNLVVERKPTYTEMRSILEKLQRNANNALCVTFPTEFDPLPRLSMVCIKLADKLTTGFLCASWHGRWTISQEKKIEFFEYLLEFFKALMVKCGLPLIVGGDFNIDLPLIKDKVKLPFKLLEYTPTARRRGRVKDYFIVSQELTLDNIISVDFLQDKIFYGLFEKFNPNDLLDHDPVIGSLRL